LLRTLFTIPGVDFGLPGFGVMLALAVYLATWLTAKRFGKLGEDPEVVWGLSMWFLVGGLVGARAFYVIQYHDQFKSVWDVFNITKGGMVFYGSAIGAFVATTWFCWTEKTPFWKLADSMAPSLPLGVAIGRIGCFLNGCCYGDYCTYGPSVQFPYGCDAGSHFVSIGSQSMLGFRAVPDASGSLRIEWVEPDTDAQKEGLEAGDRIVSVGDEKSANPLDLSDALYRHLAQYKPHRPVPPIQLGIERGDKEIHLAVRAPPSLPVHPTQVYSTIGAFLLYLYLAAKFELRRRGGLLIAECFMLYSIGRFIIEELRFDEERLFDGLTISQNVSIGVFALGLAVYIWAKTHPTEGMKDVGEGMKDKG
jgi:phosphatidylglycerol:prolipoprotein diacylglycerol transferase